MKIILNIWLAFFLLNLCIIGFKPFKYENQRITFSIWPRIATIQFLFLVILGLFVSLDTLISDSSQFRWASAIFLMAIYFIYATGMFRYEIRPNEFIWFNGLFLRRVDANSLRQITFLLKGTIVRKIEFELDGQTKRFRNDLQIENLISLFAKNINMPITRKEI
jgi:hypothetical protein